MSIFRYLFGTLLVILVAGCASGQAEVSAGSNPDPALEAGAEGVSQQDSPNPVGRMRWVPAPAGRLDTPLDLCDDSEAVEAGLDGGDLDAERSAIGLDCARFDGPRFGVVSSDGHVALGRDAAEARANAATMAHTNADGSPVQRRKIDSLGVPLGYFGPDHGAGEPAIRGANEALVVLPETVVVHDGTLRGLVLNRSATNFFSSVAAVVDGRTSASFPFVLQPFEVAPFELADWGDELPDVSSIEVVGEKTGPDRSRSILITGTPGRFFGTGAEVGDVAALNVDVPEGEAVLYFESALEAIKSTSHPEFSPAGVKASDLAALVAFVDENGRVIGQHDLEIVLFDSGPLRDDRMLFGVVGFVVPPEAADYSIWVGGTQ